MFNISISIIIIFQLFAPAIEDMGTEDSQSPETIALIEDDLSDPWARGDSSFFTRIKLLILGVTLAPIRAIFVLTTLILIWLGATLSLIGSDIGKHPERPLSLRRRAALKWVGRIGSRLLLFFAGFYHIKEKVDNGSAILVSNHVCACDPLLFFLHGTAAPSFIAADYVRDLPLMGPVASAFQCIYVKRRSGEAVTQTILHRHKLACGEYNTLVVFPEGTTVGKALIRFHKGAFIAGIPVQPVALKYSYRFWDPTWGHIHGFWHAWFLLSQFINHVTITYLPLYIPNPSEMEDPELFANNVREVMGRHLKIPIMGHLSHVDRRVITSEITKEEGITLKKARKAREDSLKLAARGSIPDYGATVTATV